MAVPSTNTSLSDIQTEFGGSNPIQLSEYYSEDSKSFINLLKYTFSLIS